MGFTLSNPTSEYIIVHEAGFKELNSVSLNVKEIGIQDLKDFLIAHSGKFLDRMPLYINHKREDIREIARKVLRGKKI